MAVTPERVDNDGLQWLDGLIEDYRSKEYPDLLGLLRQVQERAGYLAPGLMKRVALATELPLSQLYGVATFYSLFSTKPKGRYVIRVCESAPCHVEGASAVMTALKSCLGIDFGETTDCGLFTLEATSCIGVCGVAPALMVNDEVHGNLEPDDIPMIIRKYQKVPV